jgi:IclR family acetate operon transcriptional repressor
MPDEQVPRIFKNGVRKWGLHTNLSLFDLLKSLRATRKRGYAVSEEEYEDGINAVAAPIIDASHRPIAAIALVGSAVGLPNERMTVLGESVKATADSTAREIGLTP